MVSCTVEDGSKNAGIFVHKGRIELGDVNLEPLSRYTSGLKNATYTRSGVAVYNQDDKTGGLWETVDLDDVVGLNIPMSRTIVINEGKSWEPIVSSYPTGCPTHFSTALWLVNSEKKLITKFI